MAEPRKCSHCDCTGTCRARGKGGVVMGVRKMLDSKGRIIESCHVLYVVGQVMLPML